MAYECVSGATLRCTHGSANSRLVVEPERRMRAGDAWAGNILDHRSMVNIHPFGLCRSLANPAVASATSSNKGRLTPRPCVPATSKRWIPGSPSVTLDDEPALADYCRCHCDWRGVISVVDPGQRTVHVE